MEEWPPIPNPEGMGGWVFERAYLHFSRPTPKQVPPHAIDEYLKTTVEPLIEALDDILKPTHEHHLCFAYAMDVFTDYERHGSPYSGGFYDQPSSYMFVLDCIRSARDAAEGYERQKEAHESFLKQQEAEEKAREQDGGEVY